MGISVEFCSLGDLRAGVWIWVVVKIMAPVKRDHNFDNHPFSCCMLSGEAWFTCLRLKKFLFILNSTSMLLRTPGRTSLTRDRAWNNGGADNPIPKTLIAFE